MKKYICKFWLVLLISSMIFSFSSKTVGAADNENFDVKISIGFNNNYKIGYSTPVNITIKNQYKDINGEVEIRVPSSTGKYMSYVKPISLQKEAEKVITINVPVGMNRAKYLLVISNGKDKVYEDSIEIGMTSNNATSFIGILSDDSDSLSYINKVPASSGMSLLTKVIKLDDKNFPEDIFTLNAFDILVINDFDTSRFSKLQYDILKQWVGNGGTLLIGTGAKYSKTLSIFKDTFIEGTQGNVKEIATSKIYDLATNGDNKNDTKVDALELHIKDSKILMEDKDIILAQSLSKGKGVVGIVAFDLGQAPFVNWNNNTAFAEKLLEIINPNITNANKDINYIQNNYYNIREAMNQFSELASPKTSNFYLILFIYVLVVAPITYIILKKIDKREFMWVTVPALAIIFGIMVYYAGSGTRLSEITTNMISYITLDEKGNTSTSTYAGVFNTNKQKVRIEGKNGEKLIPLTQDYFNGNNQNQSSDNDVVEAKIFSGQNGGVEYKNSGLFETKVLQLQENSKSIGKIETDLHLRNSSLVGNIKNSTNIDLVDGLIIMPDGYYKIDSLKSGESIKLDNLIIKTFSGGNLHQMVYDVYLNNTNTSNMNTTQRKEYLDKRQEGSILQNMLNNGNGQADGIRLIAFSKTAIHNPLIVNGVEAKKNERNIFSIPLNLNFTNGEKIEYPMGFIPFDISNTSTLGYDSSSKVLFGNGFAELLYKIDKNMKVDEIEINASNSQINTSAYNIFNIDKKSYEPLPIGVIKGEDLKKYITEDNIVKIKLQVSDKDAAGIPQMAARGRKK